MIVIDAGHGGTDPGAISGNISEKDYTLLISNYQYDRFRQLGVPVVLTRSTDETLTPEQRVERILNAYGNRPDVIVLSNHLNAGGGQGAEVIYALRDNDRLSKIILEEIAKEGQVVRKAYQRRLPSDTSKDYYFIHRNTGVTEPVLIEYAFVDGPAADKNQITNNWRNLAEAVVRAVSRYRSLPYDIILDDDVYVVKSGDSLYSIARRFNVSIAAIRTANNLVSDVLSIGQKLIIPGLVPPPLVEVTYVVQKGDSLYSIASAYGTTTSAIMSLNNLTSTSLNIGQELKIPTPTPTPPVLPPIEPSPSPSVYTVRTGDSLYSIARQFGTTVQVLRNINNLTTDFLAPGQVLQLPEPPPAPIVPEVPTAPGTTTYTVRTGDSLYSIAQRFGTTVSELTTLNNLTTTALSIGQQLMIPGVSPTPVTTTYTVRTGDSLYSIAQRFGTTVSELTTLNNLTTTALSIGQQLLIPGVSPTPGTTTYTVRSGDSLYSIAQRFGTTVSILRSLNNLKSDLLNIGQVLFIPANDRNSDRQETNNVLPPEITSPEIPLPDIVRYTVQRGDSLVSIANRYGTTYQSIKLINNLKTDLIRVGQVLLVPREPITDLVTPRPSLVRHTVQSGDSLWGIANKYGTTVAELKRVNNLTSNIIRIGQELLLPITPPITTPPGTTTYIVEGGDTLFSIARRFGTSVSVLRTLNDIETDLINVGKILIVPTPELSQNRDEENLSKGDDEMTSRQQNDTIPVIIRYTVQRGDTLSNIANRYGTTVGVLLNVNDLDTDVLRVGQELLVPRTPIGETIPVEPTVAIYKVQRGNTLWSIARKFGTTISMIKTLNQLPSNLISINQELLVPIIAPLTPPPGTTTYVVKLGDTLWNIAQLYGTNVATLTSINDLTSDLLRPGQILLVPEQ